MIHIDQDFRSLKTYFEKLFLLRDQLEVEERSFVPTPYDGDAWDYPGTQFYASHLIKPDMVLSVYSYLEFWIQRLCDVSKNTHSLSLTYRDIRGKNDLDVYRKYLTTVVGFDLQNAESSYWRLDELRVVRNKVIHKGGHIEEAEKSNFQDIDGVSTMGSLIVIDDEFIWDTLNHAKSYLLCIAKQLKP